MDLERVRERFRGLRGDFDLLRFLDDFFSRDFDRSFFRSRVALSLERSRFFDRDRSRRDLDRFLDPSLFDLSRLLDRRVRERFRSPLRDRRSRDRFLRSRDFDRVFSGDFFSAFTPEFEKAIVFIVFFLKILKRVL